MRHLFFILALAAGWANAAPIYKCVDQSGKTQFTDKPCTGSASGTLLNAPKLVPIDVEDFGPAIKRADAAEACESAARRRANNPSTVDFSRFWSAAFADFPDGRATFASQFTAKNSFGVELRFDISCYFKGDNLAEVSVAEAR
ncbi:DUF4124 domain-containing protein [Pseudomonas sp. CrR14]|nr:DUF4124 domain-containing protein [Pseudomonas sp. CrR14]